MSDPAKREHVKNSIEGIISPQRTRQLAESPQSILKNAQVVINGSHIAGASYKTIVGGQRPKYNLTIQLTDEGRNRLWKYSMNRVGSHLLLIVDGVAIAAPIIGHALTQSELTIKGLTDEVSVREAVDRLNKKTP
jgi:preprotein translocase subunit SecD